MSSTPLAFLDGQFVPAADASLPVEDLGLQRGYGIFDYLRVSGRVPLFLEDHLDRFLRSADRMRLPVSQDRQCLARIIHEVIDSEVLTVSGIRILLTGGPSVDGYTITSPRMAVIRQPLSAPLLQLPEVGIRLFSYAFQRQLSSVKTTDYLMAVWLQPWLKEQRGDDILYHDGGFVRECPRSNIFLVDSEGVLVTPGDGMLAGVTRKQVLAVADRLGIPCQVRDVRLEEMYRAAEVFITSSTRRIVPVSQIDGRAIPSPGPVTRRLWDAFLAHEQNYAQTQAR
jgi:branched-chain amino acid aminotransferase